jgi:hypothetical protein
MNEKDPKNESLDTATTALIVRDFELVPPSPLLSEQEVITYLSEVIGYMIEHKLDFLLSLLYRLDISESSINRVLQPNYPMPAHLALAHLVWERQKQRIETKKNIHVQNADNWIWDF